MVYIYGLYGLRKNESENFPMFLSRINKKPSKECQKCCNEMGSKPRKMIQKCCKEEEVDQVCEAIYKTQSKFVSYTSYRSHCNLDNRCFQE